MFSTHTTPDTHECSDNSAELAVDTRSSAATLAVRGRRLAERGMVTAEYAVGILAAVAFALVLLKVFNNSSVLTALLHYVTTLIGQLSSYIK